MATDPNDIRLTPIQRRQLADVADTLGLNWMRLVDHFLAATNRHADEKILMAKLQRNLLNSNWNKHQNAVL